MINVHIYNCAKVVRMINARIECGEKKISFSIVVIIVGVLFAMKYKTLSVLSC